MWIKEVSGKYVNSDEIDEFEVEVIGKRYRVISNGRVRGHTCRQYAFTEWGDDKEWVQEQLTIIINRLNAIGVTAHS